MFIYREIDYHEDVPEIIGLLRTSLSENHTVESFLWKHYENPFGKSYGLLACDRDKIVGVRMFMFWEFKKGQKTVKAIRPVDTITHPEYRGKGIFKKLTLKGLEDCKGNYDMIFNTPNQNSFPGYLKMGWKKYEEDNLDFKIAFIPLARRPMKFVSLPVNQINIDTLKLKPTYYRTNLTNEYIHWRYGNDIYKAAGFEFDSGTLILIYRIERVKGLKTIVVVKIIGNPKCHNVALRSLSSKLRIFLVFYLANKSSNLNFFFVQKRKSAVVVYKEDSLNIIKTVVFTSGNLEGRL